MTKSKKNSWALRLLAVALLMTPNGWAQDAAKTNSQSDKRVGVDAGKRATMTLRDVMLMALENNRDIEVERFNVQMNEFDVRAAEGVYDPALSSSLFYDRRNTPIANPLAGGANGGLLTDNVTVTTTLSQRMTKQGGLFQGTFDNRRDTTQNVFNQLNPQYTSTLNFTFTQPIFRNRTIDPQRRQIKIAKKRLDISDSQFRQRAIEIIAQVQRAYWDLVFARRDREIKSESVDLARTQLEHNQRLVDAGTLAPADIISARVELERRNDEAEAALDAIQRAENALKALMLQPGNAEMWATEIVPVEKPQLDSNAGMPLEDAGRLALQNRPELEQFRFRGEINKIDTEFLRDQAKPQVDFFASYGTIGLAGTERGGTNFFTESGLLTTTRLN
ncbi:MAG TPA: TolC family protein, partial [Blastocatellia bacterium]|nr:TolC family protein [Blastocatellia bacterium]